MNLFVLAPKRSEDWIMRSQDRPPLMLQTKVRFVWKIESQRKQTKMERNEKSTEGSMGESVE